jgi:hypothetical protein
MKSRGKDSENDRYGQSSFNTKIFKNHPVIPGEAERRPGISAFNIGMRHEFRIIHLRYRCSEISGMTLMVSAFIGGLKTNASRPGIPRAKPSFRLYSAAVLFYH